MGKLKLIGNPLSPFNSRVLITLAYKGIDYDLEYHDSITNKESLEEKNPLGNVPVLILEDGTAIFESMGIIDLLDSLPQYADRPKVFPADFIKRAQVYMKIARLDAINTRIGPLIRGDTAKAVDNFEKDLKIFEEIIGDAPFLSGEAFGVSDINFYPWINRMLNIPEFKEALQANDKLMAWYERVDSQEAIQQDLGRVNPEWMTILLKNVKAGKAAIIWPVRDLTTE
eukprot:CAMPEP_0115005748 /NCGR_PEP_ID=MMETSP0216-20121206/20070_1 /TAXON_ID=223996 /ORGANISM="Protocruzia adherens, Strain Boccale" /LENGTH=226 /DNA_ID=CAMNT_0002372161 /DNA_START=42 /DNA_END=722 /DNA_ORIENTATION=+